MRFHFSAVLLLLLSFFSFHYSVCTAKTDKQVVVLSWDLHCQGCCDKIMKNIAFEKGVKDLVCDLKSKRVTVTYDANKTDVPTLLKAFEKIGKPAEVEESPSNQKAPEPQKEPDAVSGASRLE